jgi:hypothetical protein
VQSNWSELKKWRNEPEEMRNKRLSQTLLHAKAKAKKGAKTNAGFKSWRSLLPGVFAGKSRP